MRNRIFVVVSLVFLVVTIAGCASALQQGRASILKPSAVSPQFKDLDAPKVNPFAQPRTKVDFLVVGIRNYDSFFEESAEVNGTVVLADVVLKHTDDFIKKTKGTVKNGSELSPSEQAAVKKEQQKLDALTKLLEDVPNRSGKLIAAGDGLTKNAEKTFIGPNALKLPGVVKGLGDSMSDLRAAAQKAPGLLTHAQKTTASLATLQ